MNWWHRSNHVTDVAEVMKLRPLPLLRALVLADCPISEMDDYRLEVAMASHTHTHLPTHHSSPHTHTHTHTHAITSPHPHLSPQLQVLVALSKLERLDKEEFTEDERADAEEVLITLTPSHTHIPTPSQVSQERKAAAAPNDS